MIKNHPTQAFLTFLAAAVAVSLALWLVSLPAIGKAGPALTTTPSTTPAAAAHLPVLVYGATPTPPVTPTPSPYAAAATLHITPFKAINASTFNAGSFIVNNTSIDGARLTELRIDLSTAIFPDMVFDPFGTAGDTVAKDLTVDARVGLSFDGHSYEGEHDSGYDVLVLKFRNFDAGDLFEFSVDVDPTSIKGSGAPGPGETGSVGGLELVGATVTATFDTGAVLTNQVFRMPDPGEHSGAVAVMRDGLPGRPGLTIANETSPAVVAGPAGQPVTVVVVEGGLFTQGLPGGGHDIDPFEANTALTVREYTGVVGPGGTAEIPFVLSHTIPEGGLNIITAAFDNYYGVKGLTAAPLVLELP